MLLVRLSVGISFLFAVAIHAAKPAQRLKLTMGMDSIDVERATNGGKVLLIGYERTARDFSRVFRRVEREGIASADGDAHFDIGHVIVSSSIWVAIDITTADYGAVSPDEKKLRAGELLPDDIKKDPEGHLAKVIVRFPQVYMLLIRPAVGVWELTSGDGGPFDGDETMNGKIELGVSTLTRRGETGTSAEDFREGDLVIVFVPAQLGYLIAGIK